MKNKILQLEQNHLNLVIEKISNAVKKSRKKLADSKNNLDNLKKKYGQLNSLEKMKSKPYFARLDFIEFGESKPETIYIGKQTFIDDNNFLVYDWRAPISSIYYTGDLGKTYYKSPMGNQEVNVKLKRQFNINQQTIINIYDTNASIGDQLLLDTLSQSSSNKMKNIVSTIQSEQNKVIRNNQDTVLAVQGIAGSGKTAVLLQRVAWLLYQYRSTVNSKQILILSPNELFSSYINGVLPDLGEPNALQLTFTKLFKENSWVPNYHIENLTEQVTHQTTNFFLRSTACFNRLAKYCQLLNKAGCCFKSIKDGSKSIMTSNQLKQIFYSFNENYKLFNRFTATQERAQHKLERYLNKIKRQKWVEEEIGTINPQTLGLVERQQKFSSITAEQNYWRQQIVMKNYHEQIAKINSGSFIDIITIAVNFLKSLLDSAEISDNQETVNEINVAIQKLKNQKIDPNLSAILLFIQQQLSHEIANKKIKFVLIDEIQDYTPIQIGTVKTIYPKAKFTFLGDANQNIFENNYNIFEDINHIFKEDEVKMITLNRSYRSSAPITAFTSNLLPQNKFNHNIQSVNRTGLKPQLITVNQDKDMIKALIKLIRLNQDMQIAVICKSLSEAQSLVKPIKNQSIQVELVASEFQESNAKIILIPAYLAKGLEFDTVIAWNISQEQFPGEQQRLLLYTICSRAMHRLFLLTTANPSPLLSTIPSNLIDQE
ncbi:RNA polymerase recycling motor HelD [Liquorilactobacillus mali]|uniref:RNA polymerase recycling motor HelD n=1 Tax=Liquorilactobacillus mali TaxID=1618 RepID=UPI0029552AC7|nr:RNA polymerase recycling motor HelD [Liquorilactobacillus mali]MDV7757963.1 AAA family ATPase [Liquorilactobacillus mali]